MSHQPMAVQNGRYVSTKWALGLTVGFLALAVGGWGKWLQATVVRDHDKLIQATVELRLLDKHLMEMRAEINATLEIIVSEHQEFRIRLGGR